MPEPTATIRALSRQTAGITSDRIRCTIGNGGFEVRLDQFKRTGKGLVDDRWNQAIMAVIEEAQRRGIVGWVHVNGLWQHYEDGPMVRKQYMPAGICCQLVSHDRWSSSICFRPVDRNGMCKRHAAAKERSAAAEAATEAKWSKRFEDLGRSNKLAEDLGELWTEVADRLGIEPVRAGVVTCPTPATATVDAEVLRVLLMRILEDNR